MNIFFLCILFIASCRTQSHTSDANDATQAVDNNVVDGAPLNIITVVDGARVDSKGRALAESVDAVQDGSICDNVVPKSFFDKLTITKKSGSGKQSDPFVLECTKDQKHTSFKIYCDESLRIMQKTDSDDDFVVTKDQLESKCDLPNNIVYLKENLIPLRQLNETITGTGQPKDPFVVKCNNGFFAFLHIDRILLIWDKSNAGTWKKLNFFYSQGGSFSRYSVIKIEKQTYYETNDLLTCIPPYSEFFEKDSPNFFFCDLTQFNNNQKLNTYGITNLTLYITQKKNVFFVSCAKNSQEFGISCKDNGKLMDTSYGLTEKEISSEIIEKRCIICPLKDLWQKILPMNLVLSPREAEKYLLKCRVNYAKIADKRDLEAKCSDEGEWEVYQLDTGIKLKIDNLYCEREGCNGYEFSGKSSYNESIVTNYTMAVDLKNDGTEVPIEVIHLE